MGAFYHLAGIEISTQPCQGTACFVGRHQNPGRWSVAESTEPRVHCLGRCYDAPARADDVGDPHIEIACDNPVVLGNCAGEAATGLVGYRRSGGYLGLDRAIAAGVEATLSEMDASRHRGRGGAAYSVAHKWRAARSRPDGPRVVVVNADEGDPGAYIDRVLMEKDPHAVLEGLAIAAFAVGAEHAYVYVRCEYPDALRAMRAAVTEAEEAGILGDSLLGHGPALSVTVVAGKGSYVCGEETALLNALEGRRPMVRVRPPYPAERGLFGLPTVVNNVETLVSVPWIISHGGRAYAAMGSGTSRGTKAVSLNSLFVRPGLYEVEFGISLREIVDDIGGGLTGRLRGVIVGGPLAAVLPAHLLDIPFGFDELRDAGAALGHGGIIAFDDATSVVELVHHVFRFGAYESCGACTPCRVGASRIEGLFSEPLTGSGRTEWESIVYALADTSLCGHGSGLAAFAGSIIRHFGEELGNAAPDH